MKVLMIIILIVCSIILISLLLAGITMALVGNEWAEWDKKWRK